MSRPVRARGSRARRSGAGHSRARRCRAGRCRAERPRARRCRPGPRRAERRSVLAGLVALAGRPNVGKSTLVNALTGEKVAITSTVPNTTRRRIFGVANGDDWQLVLVDLPGFQRPMDPLTERLQETVDGSFDDVDAVLFVLSARDRIGA